MVVKLYFETKLWSSHHQSFPLTPSKDSNKRSVANFVNVRSGINRSNRSYLYWWRVYVVDRVSFGLSNSTISCNGHGMFSQNYCVHRAGLTRRIFSNNVWRNLSKSPLFPSPVLYFHDNETILEPNWDNHSPAKL